MSDYELLVYMFAFIVTYPLWYPLLLVLPHVVLFFILILISVLTKMIQMIASLFGAKIEPVNWHSVILDDSIPKCRRSKKSFWGNIWHLAKHPDVMVNIIQKAIKSLLKMLKMDTITCQDCKYSLENEMQERKRKNIFVSTKKWENFLQIYHHVCLTMSKCVILATLYVIILEKKLAFSMTVLVFIPYTAASVYFLTLMLPMNEIPSTNHMTAKTAVKFISNMKLNCKLHVSCFHTETEGSGENQNTKTVTTWYGRFLVPITEWLDTGEYNYEDATGEVENILKKYTFFAAKTDFDCKPEDKETEEAMQRFMAHHIERNKHRDKSISAKFKFEITNGNNNVVEKIVVHRDGFDVPNTWLGQNCFKWCSYTSHLLGISPIMMVILLMKRNYKRMVVSKNFKILNSSEVDSNTSPRSLQDNPVPKKNSSSRECQVPQHVQEVSPRKVSSRMYPSRDDFSRIYPSSGDPQGQLPVQYVPLREDSSRVYPSSKEPQVPQSMQGVTSRQDFPRIYPSSGDPKAQQVLHYPDDDKNNKADKDEEENYDNNNFSALGLDGGLALSLGPQINTPHQPN